MADQIPEESTKSGAVTRLHVNIGPETAGALNRLVETEGVTVTEALRRLVSYGNFVYEEHKAGGRVLLNAAGTSKTRQLVIL